MATAEQDVHVPVREGEYGDRVVAIEPGGVEYIPLSERHGRPLDLFWLTFTIIVVAQVVVAFFGHNLVHAFERYAFWPLVIVFGLATVFAFTHVNFVGFNPKAPVAFGGDTGAFFLVAAACFGYAAGW